MRKVVGVLALLSSCLLAGGTLRADEPSGGKAPAASPKADGHPEAATPTRAERAKALVKQLEDAVARAKAASPVDAQMLVLLMTALDQARALAKPIQFSELTPDEQKGVAGEAKAKEGDDGTAGGGPGADWADRMVEKAFDGADLSEEESIKAKKILADWWKEQMGSWGDSKKRSDLKRKRDDDLEKAVGKKKAQKIINNLNSMGPGRK